MRSYFYLNVEFDGSFDKAYDYDFEDNLGREAKKCNGEFSGAGAGFGVRDIGFIFKTEKSAEKFRSWLGRRKRAWRIRGISISKETA